MKQQHWPKLLFVFVLQCVLFAIHTIGVGFATMDTHMSGPMNFNFQFPIGWMMIMTTTVPLVMATIVAKRWKLTSLYSWAVVFGVVFDKWANPIPFKSGRVGPPEESYVVIFGSCVLLMVASAIAFGIQKKLSSSLTRTEMIPWFLVALIIIPASFGLHFFVLPQWEAARDRENSARIAKQNAAATTRLEQSKNTEEQGEDDEPSPEREESARRIVGPLSDRPLKIPQPGANVIEGGSVVSLDGEVTFLLSGPRVMTGQRSAIATVVVADAQCVTTEPEMWRKGSVKSGNGTEHRSARFDWWKFGDAFIQPTLDTLIGWTFDSDRECWAATQIVSGKKHDDVRGLRGEPAGESGPVTELNTIVLGETIVNVSPQRIRFQNPNVTFTSPEHTDCAWASWGTDGNRLEIRGRFSSDGQEKECPHGVSADTTQFVEMFNIADVENPVREYMFRDRMFGSSVLDNTDRSFWTRQSLGDVNLIYDAHSRELESYGTDDKTWRKKCVEASKNDDEEDLREFFETELDAKTTWTLERHRITLVGRAVVKRKTQGCEFGP